MSREIGKSIKHYVLMNRHNQYNFPIEMKTKHGWLDCDPDWTADSYRERIPLDSNRDKLKVKLYDRWDIKKITWNDGILKIMTESGILHEEDIVLLWNDPMNNTDRFYQIHGIIFDGFEEADPEWICDKLNEGEK